MLKNNRYIIIVVLCVVIPLLESLNPATLWGLNFESPLVMANLGNIILVLKIVSVATAAYLLFYQQRAIADAFNRTAFKVAFFSTFYILAALQLAVLFWGLVSFLISPSNDFFHYEKTIDDQTFYVHNADSGALGGELHVYLKCPLALNRYKLEPIGSVEWLKNFDLTVVDNTVVLSSSDTPEGVEQVYKLPIGGASCGKSRILRDNGSVRAHNAHVTSVR